MSSNVLAKFVIEVAKIKHVSVQYSSVPGEMKVPGLALLSMSEVHLRKQTTRQKLHVAPWY